MAERTVTFRFETEDQARRFDEAMTAHTGDLRPTHFGPDVAYIGRAVTDRFDLALAVELLAAAAVNARPSAPGLDPDAVPVSPGNGVEVEVDA